MSNHLRISNKYGSVTALKQCPNQTTIITKQQPAHHWSENFLEIRHQFHTSILLSNWILTKQQTLIWNLGSDACFEYTSCYFKVVTLFVRSLFRVDFHIYYLFVIINQMSLLKFFNTQPLRTKYLTAAKSKIISRGFLSKISMLMTNQPKCVWYDRGWVVGSANLAVRKVEVTHDAVCGWVKSNLRRVWRVLWLQFRTWSKKEHEPVF
jgi:hypothetical protein